MCERRRNRHSFSTGTHLEAVRLQAAGLLEGGRRLRVVHHLEVGTPHLAPHPPCSSGDQGCPIPVTDDDPV